MSAAVVTLSHIPMERAYLCLDCEAVGNSAMNCPACAGGALLSLAAILHSPRLPQKSVDATFDAELGTKH